jgi:hypothetical protein
MRRNDVAFWQLGALCCSFQGPTPRPFDRKYGELITTVWMPVRRPFLLDVVRVV